MHSGRSVDGAAQYTRRVDRTYRCIDCGALVSRARVIRPIELREADPGGSALTFDRVHSRNGYGINGGDENRLGSRRSTAQWHQDSVPSMVRIKELAGHTLVGRSQVLDLVPNVAQRLETEILPHAARQLGGDRPVGPGHCWSNELLTETAPPTLDVREGSGTLV